MPLAQGRDCTGFRAYLSTGLPQYDSQSYEFFGHLVGSDGSINAIALMSQGNSVIPGLQVPLLTIEESGLIFNRLDQNTGPAFGGIDGLADITVPTSISYQPWQIHVEQQNNGQSPQTVDMRVVTGAIGAVGAVYELTVSVDTGIYQSGVSEPTTLTIRARDTTGIIQWGYGPNGFFPLWMFDGTPLPASSGPIATTDQRTAIMNTYGGDIGSYLAETNDPMTGQGSHYYSMPLVEVESWSIQIGSTYAGGGTGGVLFFDNLTETYNDSAKYIVSNGYAWTEFSVQLPDTEQGMLIAVTGQQDVGNLYYAMLGGAGSSQSANGTLNPTANWPQGAIHITPDPASAWTSPHSCYVYELSYAVTLDASASRPGADLVFRATAQDQELNALGRAVYEGLFSYSGTLDGKAVSGYAWGEIQGRPPAGSPTPPNC
ncbi:lipocalin family protein [Microbacterium sp.]|uniref:lipocalin family protein n=1 Tax=unclassified Microbacterium TaxID=2609290 RepID=UPI00260A8401|nr:lipocalin family protein [Microbacterium sp.]